MDYHDLQKLDYILKNYELTDVQRSYLSDYLTSGEYQKTANKFGVNESTIRRTVKGLLDRFQTQQSTVPATMDEEVPSPFTVQGYSAMYGQDGERKIHWVKTKRDQEDIYKALLESIEELSQQLPKLPARKKQPKVDPDVLTVYPLGDPHIGLLTYTPEVGTDWDLSIAEEKFLPLFDKLVTAAPSSQECLIIDLGDFWHYDGMEQRTMRSGHKVDADGRPSKMIMVGYRILRRMIESALNVHDTVNVKILPGNHDDLGSIFLRVSLAHIYENEPRVYVDQSPNVFQYFHWGQNLLGMHHGDKCKLNNLPMVMAADQPEGWGNSRYRKWLVGHFHHDSNVIYQGKEMQGCTVETFRTIVANEGYAHEAGWRSGQDGKAIVFHREYGEIERYTVNISQVR